MGCGICIRRRQRSVCGSRPGLADRAQCLGHDVGNPATRAEAGYRGAVLARNASRLHEASSPNGSILRFAQGDVGEVLVRLSTDADLLVIGTREPMRGGPYLAGSVSHYCISHARCPVVAVPEQPSNPQRDVPDERTRHYDRALQRRPRCHSSYPEPRGTPQPYATPHR